MKQLKRKTLKYKKKQFGTEQNWKRIRKENNRKETAQRLNKELNMDWEGLR